jgi:hypothetical protein
MSIKDKINADLKEAMKRGDKRRTETLRGLKSAIKYAEIEAGTDALDEPGVMGVIGKQAKQRRDSIAEFEKGGRTDLVEQEQAELEILEQYLPAQMTEAEITEKAQEVVAELGATHMKDMGQVMSRLMADLKGRADGKLVNQIVRQLLKS